MLARYMMLPLALVGILAGAGRSQTTQPYNSPVVAMDLSSVSFDWATPYWKPDVEGVPPLFVIGGSPIFREPTIGEYSSALHGLYDSGTRKLLGYLGGPFPEGSTIIAEKYDRQGQQIHLIIRYVAKPATPQKRVGSICFFFAAIDETLADGKYTLTVELKDLPNDLKVPNTQVLQFQKPDPRFNEIQEYATNAQKLSPQALFEFYKAHCAQMKGVDTPREARLLGTAMIEHRGMDSQKLSVLQNEIVRRRLEISPILIDALKEQSVRNPEPISREMAPPLGLARDLMAMLTEIGDARAAYVMIDILSGKLKCNRYVEYAAEEYIETLTLVRFRIFESHYSSYATAVRGPDAIVEKYGYSDGDKVREDYLRDLANKYTKWIAEHPAKDADATPWANEAVRTAHEWLDGNDLSEACNAASFLRFAGYRSRVVDDPARTTRRIAAILDQCELTGSQKSGEVMYYTYVHKPTGQKVDVYEWVELLTRDAPIPMEYAGLLIRFDREMSENSGIMARNLMCVGGVEAMQYRVEAYNRLVAEVNKVGINPRIDINTMQDRTNMSLVMNCQLYRLGIERWAGRTFTTDADLNAWWNAEKNKTPQQWLEAGLAMSASRADAGDRQSQYLLRLMLGDALPNPPNHFVWLEPGTQTEPPPRAEAGEPFRVKWLADHAGKLRCDVEKGCFVVDAK